MTGDRPGSRGERRVQEELGTRDRALGFYEKALHARLTERMRAFIAERILFFLATADADGRTDCSPRLGPPGFVTVLDDERLCYPEYRGNGVHASLGNITENPYATLLFVDWWEKTVGLHVNGRATLYDEVPGADDPVERHETWVVIEVEEAYIHCAKHLPRLRIEEFDPPWGTDDPEAKQSGYFSD